MIPEFEPVAWMDCYGVAISAVEKRRNMEGKSGNHARTFAPTYDRPLYSEAQMQQAYESGKAEAEQHLQGIPKMKTTKRNEVFEAIDSERDHQDQKWGTLEQHPHEVGSWLTIMRNLLSEADAAYCCQRGDAGALEEIRKVAAVGVACMEQHGAPKRRRKEIQATIDEWRERS